MPDTASSARDALGRIRTVPRGAASYGTARSRMSCPTVGAA